MIQVSACLGTNREVNEEENGGAPAYNEKKRGFYTRENLVGGVKFSSRGEKNQKPQNWVDQN